MTASGCQVCPDRGDDCDGRLHGHHVVRQQVIERHVATIAKEQMLSLDAEAEMLASLLWNVGNGMGACDRAHSRHHSRRQPIERCTLPPGAVQFACDHQLMRWIEQEYPECHELTGRG